MPAICASLRHALLAATAALLFVAAAALATPASAADQLVWEGQEVLEISNENGTNRRVLTSGCGGLSAVHPAISPDGQTVAYSRFGGSICTIGVDGSSPRVIVSGQSAANPDWTPDGRYVFFEALPSNGFNIYKATVNGTSMTPVITWAGDQSGVTVSPSGTRIAFSSDKTPAGKALSSRHVYTTDMNGTTPVDVGIGTAPAYSPDGSKLVFEKGGNIYTAASSGGRATQLTTGGLDATPDWSPNGQIAFMRRTSSGVGYYNIWQMSSTGSGQTMIVPRGAVGSVLTPSYRQPSTVIDGNDIKAAQLSPTILFDSGERWRPINVNWFLGETHYVCYAGSCGIVSTPEGLRMWPNAGSRIDIEGDGGESNYASPAAECNVNGLQDCDTGPRAAIYYHVSQSPGGYTYLDYWFFYRYNDTPDISFTDHEGDWESVSVAASKTVPDTFDFASFSGHGHWFSYLRDNLGCDGGPGGSCGTESSKYGKRVNTYVAAGSHANYAEPCGGPCTQSNGPTPEMDHDGAYIWGRHNDPPADSVLEMPPTAAPGQAWTAGPQNWTDWPGLWSVNGGIDSPGNQGHFKTPWLNNECVDGSSCPPQSKIAAAARTKTRGLESCSSWFGPGVSAVACDPRRLKAAVDGRDLGRRGSFRIAAKRKGRSASAPGIAQALGRPLRDGQTVDLVGTGDNRTQLLVRVKSGRSVYAATFGATGLSTLKGHARVRVASSAVQGAGAKPRLVLVRPDGTIVKPDSVQKLRNP